MGPRSSLLYPYEDPWRASAFIYAFTQLVLTVLVLLHTILACITSLLVKWYAWWLPYCRDGVCQPGPSVRFDSWLLKKPLNLDSNGNRSSCSPLISTERFLKRSRNEDWRFVKSKPLVCPRCHGVLSFKQGLSSRYDRGAASQWGETSTCADAGSSSIARGAYVEAGVRSNYACAAKTYGALDKLVRMNSCVETINFSEENNACGSKIYDSIDKAAHGISCLQTTDSVEASVNNADVPVDSTKRSQTPVQESHRLVNEEGMEAIFTEEAGSSTKGQRGDQLNRLSHSGMTCPLKELQDEIVDEEVSVDIKKMDDSRGYDYENVIQGSRDEEFSASTRKKNGSKDYDTESVIKGLRAAVEKERKKLCALYTELEVERIASETAANEAMSMISRLQEEKAALRMQAAHYQRMAEEKAIYDDQAMQLLKEILYRKERENYLLEKEVKVMRIRFCKDVRKFGKRRKGVERMPSFGEAGGTLLLKNVEEVSNLSQGCDMRDGAQQFEIRSSVGVLGVGMEKPPCPSRITEDQPLKRLKSIVNHENGTCKSVFPALDTSHMHQNTDFVLVGGVDERAQNCLVDCCDSLPQESISLKEASNESQQSDSAIAHYNSTRVFNTQLQEQEMTKDSAGMYLLSQCEITLDAATGGRDKFSEDSVPLDVTQNVASAMYSALDAVPDKKECQKILLQNAQLHLYCARKEINNSGECIRKGVEIVCPNEGTHHGQQSLHLSNGVLAIMSCSGPSGSVASCGTTDGETRDQADANDGETQEQAGARDGETQDQVNTEFLNRDLKNRTDGSPQARLQTFESDKTPQSCPSSLNHKGPGINKVEESDSSLMRSRVY